VRRALLSLIALLLVAAAPPVVQGPIRLCPGLRAGPECRAVDRTTIRLDRPETMLVRTVTVEPGALPLARPSMVWVVAMASAEVRWNGVLVGRNGVPAPTRAGEVPGRFVSTFVVPAALMRPGENLVSIRLSAHNLWLPVRTPIHTFEIAPYETPNLPGLRDYLPALLMLGALLAGLVYFTAAFLADRRDRKALIVAATAATAGLQLIVEVSRAFIAYSYPWHLARVGLIALLAAAAAILIASYGARRFAPERERPLVAGTALASLASLLAIPWYDIKALGALCAGGVALAVAAALGFRAQRRAAAVAFAAGTGIVALAVWHNTLFLDRSYYLLLAALLIALVAEQVIQLRRARAERDAETRRAAGLADRLAKAERRGEAIVALKDGSRVHRVAEGDILYIRAADDYCEAVLKDGRTLLSTMTLVRLLATLPERIARVHKSYAVNRPHVASIAPRPGGGTLLTLSDGSDIPVGRAYAAAVTAWLS
jgi:DNA-binding LytR/AlgR family response regulator